MMSEKLETATNGLGMGMRDNNFPLPLLMIQ